MDLARDDFLADAALALDQHRDVGLADPLDHAADLPHRGADPDGLTDVSPHIRLAARTPPHATAVETEAVEGRIELDLFEGLGQIVRSAGLHRLDDRARTADHRHHQDGKQWPAYPDRGERRESVLPGHHDVEQDEVRIGSALEQRDGSPAIVAGIGLEAAGFEDAREIGAHPVRIVDDQDAWQADTLVGRG